MEGGAAALTVIGALLVLGLVADFAQRHLRRTRGP